MRPWSGFRIALSWPYIERMTMTSQFIYMKSASNFFDVAMFILSSLVTSPSFMSISLLVLELRQFSFIKDWPEIRKSEIPPPEFCPISRDCSKLGIPNFARIRVSLKKCYYMLQNARVKAFTVSELLSENQQRLWKQQWKPTVKTNQKLPFRQPD